jgi:hypothetical protein
MGDDMELDDLKRMWEEQDRKLQASLRIERVSLRGLGRAEAAMGPLTLGLEIEVALAMLFAVALGSFAASHVAPLRVFASSIAVDVYVLALGVLAARQILAIRRLDWSRPVTAIQTRLESLRLERARTVLAAVLVGTVLWIPAVAVVVAAVGGVDLYGRVSPAWLAGNFAFAAGAIVAALWWARRRAARGATMNGWLVAALSGTSLRSALAVLAELREFEGTSGAPGTDANTADEGRGEP